MSLKKSHYPKRSHSDEGFSIIMFLPMYWPTTPHMVTQKRLVMDNGTLRDHLADVISERNELLRKIQQLEAQIYRQGITLGFLERRIENMSTDND